VDLVIAVSEATRRQMITELGVAPDKVVVLESGVPEAFISEGRTSHGGPFRLLWVGSLSREKDPEAAVRVVQRALASSDVVLRIVGDGPLRDDLASLIVEESMSRAVELVGSARDVLAHLSWADALLLSSRTEGLPGSVLEAAASGIPSVAFDVGGTKEVVLDDVTGKLVRSGDEDAMVEAIIELARDEGKRRKMGTAAQRMVRERFLMEHAVDRYHRVLLERFLPGEGLPSDRPDQ
jgi:glycosyltransferase involved in cell wall biosynthesis